jgi:hypothetical protein
LKTRKEIKKEIVDLAMKKIFVVDDENEDEHILFGIKHTRSNNT